MCPGPVGWCKYNRDRFARKDELSSQVKNGYHGERMLGFKAGQVINQKVKMSFT